MSRCARVATQTRRTLLGVRARLLAARLDAHLAGHGALPSSSLLAVRSHQLVTRHERERLASALERLRADRSRRAGFSTAIPVDASALRVAAPALGQLAQALRVRGSVSPRGVALTRLLLTEPASPLYRPQHSGAVYEAAREALLEL